MASRAVLTSSSEVNKIETSSAYAITVVFSASHIRGVPIVSHPGSITKGLDIWQILRGQPCRTPLWMEMGVDISPLTCTTEVAFSYII